MSKIELFLKLAKPDANGVSRSVKTSEFIGEYSSLVFGNGASWARASSTLAKKYKVEFIKNNNTGNGIIGIKLSGLNNDTSSQTISAAIKNEIRKKRCVVLGTSKPEVDHKNGRKDDARIHTTHTQTISDFQPLSKAANDAKRQYCKECKATGKRYDAKKLGYPISFYCGNETYIAGENGCIGCFWFDPLEFRKNLTPKKDGQN